MKRANTVAIASLTQTSISPKLLLDRLRGRLDLLVVGDVGRDGQRLAAERFDLRAGAVEALLAAGQQPDVGAALGERVRDRASDPAGGAGDDDDLGLVLACSSAGSSSRVRDR